MAVSATGTSVVTAATSGSVTASLTAAAGTVNATPGNILVAACVAMATTSATIPTTATAGWTRFTSTGILSNSRVGISFWYCLRGTGAATAPAFTSTVSGTRTRMVAIVWDLADAVMPEATSGTATGTTQNPSVTTGASVPATGGYALAAHGLYTGSNASDTWTKDAAWTGTSYDDTGSSYAHAAFDQRAGPPSGSALACGGTWGTTGSYSAAMSVVLSASTQTPETVSGAAGVSGGSGPKVIARGFAETGGAAAGASGSGPETVTVTPPLVLTNNFAGLSPAGTIPTAGNSGGTSGDAFDTVVAPAAGSTFASDATYAILGPYSLKVATGVTSDGPTVQWSSSLGAVSKLYFETWLRFTANPAANFRVLQLGAGSVGAFLRITTGGQIALVGLGTAGTLCTITTTFPLGAWFRVEGFINLAAGTAELKLFSSPGSATATETQPASGITYGGSSVSVAVAGVAANAANIATFWIGGFGLNDTTYLGPAGGFTENASGGAGAGGSGSKTVTAAVTYTETASGAAGAAGAGPKTLTPAIVVTKTASGAAGSTGRGSKVRELAGKASAAAAGSGGSAAKSQAAAKTGSGAAGSSGTAGKTVTPAVTVTKASGGGPGAAGSGSETVTAAITVTKAAGGGAGAAGSSPKTVTAAAVISKTVTGAAGAAGTGLKTLTAGATVTKTASTAAGTSGHGPQTITPAVTAIETGAGAAGLAGSGSKTVTPAAAVITKAASGAAGSSGYGQKGPKQQVAVSFTWDDGRVSQAAAASIFSARGLPPGTFYLNTDFTGTGGYMSWAQLAALVAAGGELGSHTANHTVMTTVTHAVDVANIQRDIDALTGHGYPRPYAFSYPNGTLGTTTDGYTVKLIPADMGFTSARWTGSQPNALEAIPPPDAWQLHLALSALDNTTTLAAMQGAVLKSEAAGTAGSWVIFLTHDIDGATGLSSVVLGQFLDWLKDRSSVTAKTVTAARGATYAKTAGGASGAAGSGPKTVTAAAVITKTASAAAGLAGSAAKIFTPAAPPGLEIAMAVSGAEFMVTDDHGLTQTGFSNRAKGTYNSDYHYEGVDSTSASNTRSWTYLHSRGWRRVKIPLVWERLTDYPGSPLNATQVQYLTLELDRLHDLGMTAALDAHQYGLYYLDGADCGATPGTGYRYAIGVPGSLDGQTRVTAAHFADFWARIVTQFQSHPAVTGVHLMNEPMGGGTAGSTWDGRLTRTAWYAAAQAAVTAIRAAESVPGKWSIRVGGWHWSDCDGWETVNSPGLVMTDPGANTWYEAHHYWWAPGAGAYAAFQVTEDYAYSAGYRAGVYPNATTAWVIDKLETFAAWVAANAPGSTAVIGEIGLPKDADTLGGAGDMAKWNAVLTVYLARCAQLGVAIDGWVAGEFYGSGRLTVYYASNGRTSGLDTAQPDAAPWENALAAAVSLYAKTGGAAAGSGGHGAKSQAVTKTAGAAGGPAGSGSKLVQAAGQIVKTAGAAGGGAGHAPKTLTPPVTTAKNSSGGAGAAGGGGKTVTPAAVITKTSAGAAGSTGAGSKTVTPAGQAVKTAGAGAGAAGHGVKAQVVVKTAGTAGSGSGSGSKTVTSVRASSGAAGVCGSGSKLVQAAGQIAKTAGAAPGAGGHAPKTLTPPAVITKTGAGAAGTAGIISETLTHAVTVTKTSSGGPGVSSTGPKTVTPAGQIIKTAGGAAGAAGHGPKAQVICKTGAGGPAGTGHGLKAQVMCKSAAGAAAGSGTGARAWTRNKTGGCAAAATGTVARSLVLYPRTGGGCAGAAGSGARVRERFYTASGAVAVTGTGPKVMTKGGAVFSENTARPPHCVWAARAPHTAYRAGSPHCEPVAAGAVHASGYAAGSPHSATAAAGIVHA